MKEVSRLASRMSPSLIFLVLICSIFVSEALIPLFIEIFPSLPRWGVLLLNAILQSILILPIIYFYIFRPLTTYITECNQIEEALRESEDHFCSMAEEMSVIAEIGRVIGSTLEINEVCERFAAEARKLIPFDRITVNLCNIRENIVTFAYVSGADLSNWKQGDSIPLTGTLVEEFLRKRTGQIIQSEKMDEIVSRIPPLSRTFQAGLRSIIGIPLIYKDEPIGILQFRSKTPDAYTDQDLRLAERIGVQIAGTIANAKLLSDCKRVEEALRDKEQRLSSIYNTVGDIIFHLEVETEGQYRFVSVNSSFCRVTGLGQEQIVGKTATEVIPEPSLTMVLGKYRQAIEAKTIVRWEEVSDYPTGRLIGEVSVAPVFDEKGRCTHLVGSVHDITDRKQAEEALRESENRSRKLSIVDDLTQLYNSRHFYHQLKMEIDRSDRYGQPLTLLLLDLDDFKRYNDTYGHIEGDQVLRRLSQVVRRCLRQTDSAYRYGGEEFTILLPMTASADAAVTAERIRTEFKKETFSPVSDQDVHVTVSIGLAQYKPQEEIKIFVHRVDRLMYQGKKNGKDKVCCGS